MYFQEDGGGLNGRQADIAPVWFAELDSNLKAVNVSSAGHGFGIAYRPRVGNTGPRTVMLDAS